MKISYIALLSISLSYGLERPLNVEENNDSTSKSIDLSKVKPIAKQEIIKEDSVEKPLIRPEIITDPSPVEQKDLLQPTWLGVSGEPISKTLGMHLGIEEGIVLRVVADESPASVGGLKEHDIITEVNQTKISNQEVLRDQILSFSPGDEITVKVISQGESKQYPITLQERPAQSVEYGNTPAPRFSERSSRSPFEQFPPSQRSDADSTEPKRGLGKMLKDMGLNKLLQEADPGKAFNLDFQSTSTIRIQDGEGSVEVQTLNGERNIVVRDRQGNVQFQGPWNTDEDKENVSPEIKERVENIDFNYKNHSLRFGKKEKAEIR